MRREVYDRKKNEIEQQMARHNLQKDMAGDYETSVRVSPADHVRDIKAQSLGRIVFLVLLIGGFGLAVWLY